MVNNAGFEYPADFDKRIRGSSEIVRGSCLRFDDAVRAAWPHLVKSGSGRVVNTVSTACLWHAQRTAMLRPRAPCSASQGAGHRWRKNMASRPMRSPRWRNRMADAANVPDEVRDFHDAESSAESSTTRLPIWRMTIAREWRDLRSRRRQDGSYAISEGQASLTRLSPEMIERIGKAARSS